MLRHGIAVNLFDIVSGSRPAWPLPPSRGAAAGTRRRPPRPRRCNPRFDTDIQPTSVS